jgi:hypothetical protein
MPDDEVLPTDSIADVMSPPEMVAFSDGSDVDLSSVEEGSDNETDEGLGLGEHLVA